MIPNRGTDPVDVLDLFRWRWPDWPMSEDEVKVAAAITAEDIDRLMEYRDGILLDDLRGAVALGRVDAVWLRYAEHLLGVSGE